MINFVVATSGELLSCSWKRKIFYNLDGCNNIQLINMMKVQFNFFYHTSDYQLRHLKSLFCVLFILTRVLRTVKVLSSHKVLGVCTKIIGKGINLVKLDPRFYFITCQ